ncbi:hypothetical protein [Phreatobacter cathodiphilus]|uniref:von Hippel-Lindau disease tumour suppressor beta domain-containing protein n=1 Tax=Phreatobacter cathodiphilus TaxID=1868589 RepID=A0A2S0N8H0_9HYPH|nr:hypothetical protein [Phreatobacter cathodiphilus]AVO44438.1 hypothetical protein C6569_04820 [Phreatobacter cathodiphilus]
MKLACGILGAGLIAFCASADAQSTLSPTFEACQPTGSVRTEQDGRPTRITFRADRTVNGALNLFWIDHSGEAKPYGRLAPGQSIEINTYLGHMWMATDGSSCAYQQVEAGARSITFVVDATSATTPAPATSRPQQRLAVPSIVQPGGGKNSYGGYDIVGPNQSGERPYAPVRDWGVNASWVGGAFAYCAAEAQPGGRVLRIGYDSGQWQLAVQAEADPDWSGTLDIDGRQVSVSGAAVDGWAIAWLQREDLSRLGQGQQANLSVGRAYHDFPLTGMAAAITKVEECVQRRGVVTSANPRPPGQATTPPPVPSQFAGVGPGPDELVAAMFRDRDVDSQNNATRLRYYERYLSRRLNRLIAEDFARSARDREPGRLDFSLLSGMQDALERTGVQLTPAAIQGDRATITGTVMWQFGSGRDRQTGRYRLRFQLEQGDRGWRVIDIGYLQDDGSLRSLLRMLGG